MTRKSKRHLTISGLALSSLLSGCASTDEVRELTRVTNRNITKVSSNIQRFERNSDALQKRLVAEIDKVNAAAASDRRAVDKNRIIWKLANAKQKDRLFESTQALGEAIAAAVKANTAEATKARQKAILDRLEPSTATSDAFNSVQKKIAELLKSDDSTKTRLRALLQYTADVGKEIEKAEDDNKK